MTVREELNQLKRVFDVSTDQGLADILKVNKRNLDNWVQRGALPAKWKIIISGMLAGAARGEAKLPLGGTPDFTHIAEEFTNNIAKAQRQEQNTIDHGNKQELPTDIKQIVEILKEFDTKKRRDVLRYILEKENE